MYYLCVFKWGWEIIWEESWKGLGLFGYFTVQQASIFPQNCVKGKTNFLSIPLMIARDLKNASKTNKLHSLDLYISCEVNSSSIYPIILDCFRSDKLIKKVIWNECFKQFCCAGPILVIGLKCILKIHILGMLHFVFRNV